LSLKDQLYGNLPGPLVADVTATGCRYFHLNLDGKPTHLELNDADLKRSPPKPIEVRAWKPGATSLGIQTSLAPKPDQATQVRNFMWLFLALSLVGFLLNASYDLASTFVQTGSALDKVRSAIAFPFTLGGAGFLSWQLWNQRHKVLTLSVRKSAQFQPRRGLIIGLSPIFRKQHQSQDHWLHESADGMRRATLSLLAADRDAFQGKMKDQPELSNWKNSWQQAFRSISASLPRLECVIVIGSGGSNGSGHQLPTFCETAARLVAAEHENRVVVLPSMDEPVDFEDHDEIRQTLENAIAQLRRAGIEDDDIAIDITGGTKIFSLAAAAFTINRDLNAIYVTNAGKVTNYSANAALGEIS